VGVRRDQRVDVNVKAPDQVTGPVRKGTVRGRVAVTVDGRTAGSAALLASRSIPRASAFDRVSSGATSTPVLIGIGAVAILVAALALRRRRSRGPLSEEEMRRKREERRRMRDHRRNGPGGGSAE
jgi:MYXO-CTERM domain-containing protein